MLICPNMHIYANGTNALSLKYKYAIWQKMKIVNIYSPTCCSKLVWLVEHTSSSMFYNQTNMRVSKWWQNLDFSVNYPFKVLKCIVHEVQRCTFEWQAVFAHFVWQCIEYKLICQKRTENWGFFSVLLCAILAMALTALACASGSVDMPTNCSSCSRPPIVWISCMDSLSSRQFEITLRVPSCRSLNSCREETQLPLLLKCCLIFIELLELFSTCIWKVWLLIMKVTKEQFQKSAHE